MLVFTLAVVVIDADMSGQINAEEFLAGCLRLRGKATTIDVAKLSHDHKIILRQMEHSQGMLIEKLDKLSRTVWKLSKSKR